MSVSLAPTIGLGYQAFDTAGAPLNAGLIYTYAAGGTTPKATYTDYTGVTPNANPIVLGADGRPPNQIWLTAATSYKFVLKTSAGTTISTFDNIAT